MALLRLAAAAQQRNTVLASALQDPTDRSDESGLLSHLRVQCVPVSIKVLLALGASAERETEKDIADAAGSDRGLKLLTVEVRSESRVGVRAYVQQKGDPVAVHQASEPLEVVV